VGGRSLSGTAAKGGIGNNGVSAFVLLYCYFGMSWITISICVAQFCSKRLALAIGVLTGTSGKSGKSSQGDIRVDDSEGALKGGR
jgi:hypothetical protein